MLETIDIVRSGGFIIDAQQRDDGLIEAVYLNGQDEEELLFYESCLDKNNKLVRKPGKIPKAEMFRWDENLRTWFHSPKTLIKYKKNKKKTDESEL